MPTKYNFKIVLNTVYTGRNLFSVIILLFFFLNKPTFIILTGKKSSNNCSEKLPSKLIRIIFLFYTLKNVFFLFNKHIATHRHRYLFSVGKWLLMKITDGMLIIALQSSFDKCSSRWGNGQCILLCSPFLLLSSLSNSYNE